MYSHKPDLFLAALFPEFDEGSLVDAAPEAFSTLSADFADSVAEIKKNMNLMIKYKKEGINDRESYQQLRTQGCLQIAILKRLNRFAQMGAKEIREKTKVLLLKIGNLNDISISRTNSNGTYRVEK